jgi:serine/threonine protein phosphatase PrpC
MLSEAHKPSLPGELERVCATRDGFVEVHGRRVTPANAAEVARHVRAAQAMGKKALYRINRDISLSRAIGDLDLKPFGVTAQPDVTVHRYDGRGRGMLFVVLATDGVWDVVDPRRCAALLQHAADDCATGGVCGGVDAVEEGGCGELDGAGPGERAACEGGTGPTAADARNAVARNGGDGGRVLHADKAEAAARLLVDSAHAVRKNNDDITAVVATLLLRKGP